MEPEFPLPAGRPTVRGSVESWRRGDRDAALQRLEAVVEDARPVWLADRTERRRLPDGTPSEPPCSGPGGL
ncbi:hypothetical protein CRI70_22240 [Streptomyces sp. Ru87]|nr:hypothetical protein CRI70_22240 [Streptomyces sp. Ru87]